MTPAPAPVAVVPAPAPAPVAVAPAGTVVVAPAPAALRAGLGRVESIVPVPPAAAAGGTASSTNRVTIRMDDGSAQYLDTAAAGLNVGDRVEITSDGYMKHPA